MKKIITSLMILFTCYVNAQEFKFGKVSKEELEEKMHPTDSSANAAYIYKYRKTLYSYTQAQGFYLTTEIHHRIKIYNKDGLNRANFEIGLYKNNSNKEKAYNIKGYTFNNINGKVEKTKLKKEHYFREKTSKNTNIIKIAFPNVKEGSVIDLKYTISSPFLRNIDEVQFQHDIPIKFLDITVEVPEYFQFKKASKGYYNIPPISSKRTDKIKFANKLTKNSQYVLSTSTVNLTKNIDKYRAKNIPALADNEPFVASIRSYRGGIKYELSYIKYPESSPKYYTTTWEDVSKQIYKSPNFGKEIEKTSYYQDDLSTLLTDAKTDIQKAVTIFEFVKSKIKWNGNYGKYVSEGVKKAYKDGVGNVAEVNLVLTSMLQSSGLKANPVLVSSITNSIPLFPTLDGFNYVIAMVELENGSYILLDATEPFSSPNNLPARALNWNGRKITKEGYSSWVKLTSKQHSSEEHIIKVSLDEEGVMEGFVRKKEQKLNALLTRKRLNNLDDDKIISDLEEKHEIEIDNYKLSNKNTLGKPVSQMFKFSSDNLVEEINGKLYINPLLFLTREKNPFKSEKRSFPIDFVSPWKENYKISIDIPEGYEIESLPEQMAIGLPENLGFFKFQAIKGKKGVQVNSILQFNSAKISPIVYQQIKQFYSEMITKQNEKIVLIKK